MWGLFGGQHKSLAPDDFFMLDVDLDSSLNTSGASFENRSNVPLLDGERIVQEEGDIELLAGEKRQFGTLFLTNYRLVYAPESVSRQQRVQSVPLGCIAQIEVSYNVMRVVCKYFRVLELCWTLSPTASNGMQPQDLSVSAYVWGAASVTSSSMINSPLLAFRQAVSDQCATPFGMVTAFRVADTSTYEMPYTGIEQEMQRLGVPMDQWRISRANEQFAVCASYPRRLCVPRDVTDDDLCSIAQFRSNGRLPAVTWYNMATGAAILRCAQPLVGILRAHSADDQRLVELVRANALHGRLADSANLIYLVDARPKMSAYANQAKGAGTENPANYPNSRLVFLDIENIHCVRSSYRALFDLLLGQVSGECSSGWYAGIEKTGWMDHVQNLVRGGARVADMVAAKSSVIVHCSDGWDRTAQVSSLAQLLLDPYYRTIAGFEVLIEKDWLSFGHKFGDRHTQRRFGFWSDRESSPIFAQWLDAVYQVMMQFPQAFEFNEKFLMAILDNSYSLRYVTFLGSCEKARIKFRGMPGLWHALESDRDMFLNANYCACSAQLKAEWNAPALTIWKTLYLRFFIRHAGGPGSAFSHSEPDFERADAGSERVGWRGDRSGRDDQIICLSPEADLTIFDDYETTSKKEIPLVPPPHKEESSFSRNVLHSCQVMAHSILTGTTN